MTTKLILTQEQAEHAYMAMKGALEMRGEVSVIHPDYFVTMWNTGLVHVGIKDTTEKYTWHDSTYSSPNAFADAYAAHYGLTIVEPESTIDRMVREAQERLAKQLDRDIASHKYCIERFFSAAYDRLLGQRGWSEYKGNFSFNSVDELTYLAWEDGKLVNGVLSNPFTTTQHIDLTGLD